jgi:hypothetical protein
MLPNFTAFALSTESRLNPVVELMTVLARASVKDQRLITLTGSEFAIT